MRFGPLHLLRFHQRLVWANGSWVQLTLRDILTSHTQSRSLLSLSLSAKVSLELHKTALWQALTEKFAHCSLSGRKKKSHMYGNIRKKKKRCRKIAEVWDRKKLSPEYEGWHCGLGPDTNMFSKKVGKMMHSMENATPSKDMANQFKHHEYQWIVLITLLMHERSKDQNPCQRMIQTAMQHVATACHCQSKATTRFKQLWAALALTDLKISQAALKSSHRWSKRRSGRTRTFRVWMKKHYDLSEESSECQNCWLSSVKLTVDSGWMCVD